MPKPPSAPRAPRTVRRPAPVPDAAVAAPAVATPRVRPLTDRDLPAVQRIDALQTGRRKPRYWRRVFHQVLERPDDVVRMGLAGETADGVVGYLIAEIRAFEFGSEPCGWILAVAVDPRATRDGAGSALLREACDRFRAEGVTVVRTMVRRNDVPVLSFFRSNGFAGGAYVQLERDMEEDS